MVWAVAKGSFRNKLILVPAALAISAFAPWAVTPLLMLGGAYLCFEGFEKLAHPFMHSKAEDQGERQALQEAVADSEVDLVAFEKDKVKGAVRTDFILSAEIIAITLGIVSESPLLQQVVVLSGIAIVMTVGVYGLVGGIVKLDDAGLYLSQKTGDGAWSGFQRSLGRGVLSAAPYMMKSLSVIGTAAMFMVGGGILTHGVPAAHHWVEGVAASSAQWLGVVSAIVPTLLNAVAGIIAGAVVLAVVAGVSKVWRVIKG